MTEKRRKPDEKHAPRWYRYAIPAALLLSALTFFRIILYPQHHLNNDIGGYLFAADTFLQGRISVPIPAPDSAVSPEAGRDSPYFFRTWMVIPHSLHDQRSDGSKHTRMYSKYPPGHPLLLAAGRLLCGRYWPIPILLSLLSAGAIALVTGMAESRRAASHALVLLLLSPLFVGVGASLLSHNSTLATSALGMVALVMMDRSTSRGWRVAFGIMTGFCFGFAVACRPLTGVCFCVALVLWELSQARSHRQILASRWLSLALGMGIAAAPLLWYNYSLTGSATRFPFHQYWPRSGPGFTGLTEKDLSQLTNAEIQARAGEFRGWELPDGSSEIYQHTPWNALLNSAGMLGRMNDFFLAIPDSLAALVILLLLWRRRLSKYSTLYLLQIGLVILGYSTLFRSIDIGWGPHYYYEMLLPLMLLAAPLTARLFEFAARLSTKTQLVLGVCLAILSLLHLLGVCYYPYTEEIEERDRRTRIISCISRNVKTPAVIFLPPRPSNDGNYVGNYLGNLRNDPAFSNQILYALDCGSRNHLLIDRYPGRYVYQIGHDGIYELEMGLSKRGFHAYE